MLAPRRMLEQVAPDRAGFNERFFMYGDDLDLCIRVARDSEGMSRTIFDANRDVFLKHFNPRGSALVHWK